MNQDLWCQRCMVLCVGTRCPKCGVDLAVSTLTPADRAMMARVIRGMRKAGAA